MITTQTIRLNKKAPVMGLFADVEKEIAYEACFHEKTFDAEILNFEVYVMAFANTPDHRIEKISPESVRLKDKDAFIQYRGRWFPLQSIAANSCDARTQLPAIIVGKP